MVKLSDVCEIMMGQAPASSSYNDKNLGYPLIAGAGDFGELIPNPKKSTTEASKISQVGDIILCIRATIGDLNWSDKKYCLGRGVAGLHPKENLDSKYLWYYLNSKKTLLSSKGTGSTFKQISRSHIEECKIVIPPLAEQKRIAAILDKADNIRRKREQAIKLADDFLKATFLEMFGDPVENPKKFTRKKLKEFYSDAKNGSKCGPFGSALKKEEYTNSGIPVWIMDNISLEGEFKDTPFLFISEDKYNALEAYSVEEKDIIISRAGTVGKMGVINSTSKRSIISTNLIRLRLNNELMPEFFLSLMIYCKGRVGRLKTGVDGSFTHMNTGILDNIEFPYPPLSLQRKYLKIRNYINAEKYKASSSLDMLNVIFLAISNKFFS